MRVVLPKGTIQCTIVSAVSLNDCTTQDADQLRPKPYELDAADYKGTGGMFWSPPRAPVVAAVGG